MTRVFQCTGCGIPGVSCTYLKDEVDAWNVDASDLAGMCPKKDHIPVWREMGVTG